MNEVEPDMIGKTAEKVRIEAMDLMDTVNPELDTNMKACKRVALILIFCKWFQMKQIKI